MCMLLASYSKDKRKKETTYGYLRQKVKSQPSCDSLVALYFWQNSFTPLNQRCLPLCKKMKDGNWQTFRTSKEKKVLVKVSNGCFLIRLCVFVIFVYYASIGVPYMRFVVKM